MPRRDNARRFTSPALGGREPAPGPVPGGGERSKAGEGVARDAVQAWKWFQLAANEAETDAVEAAEAVKSRDALAAGMTAAQIAEARSLVEKWKADQVESQPFGLFTK